MGQFKRLTQLSDRSSLSNWPTVPRDIRLTVNQHQPRRGGGIRREVALSPGARSTGYVPYTLARLFMFPYTLAVRSPWEGKQRIRGRTGREAPEARLALGWGLKRGLHWGGA